MNRIASRPSKIAHTLALCLAVAAALNGCGKRNISAVQMDADDIAHPKRLSRQVAYMETHPAIGVLGTRTSVVLSTRKETLSIPIDPTHHSEKETK